MKLLLVLGVSALLCQVSLQSKYDDDSKCILAKVHNPKRSLPNEELDMRTREANPLLHLPTVDAAVQTVALTLAGEVPVVGTYLSAFVSLFWPQKKGPSVWEQVEEKVQEAIHAAFTQQFRDFWKYVKREMVTVMGETGPGLERRRYTRLHGLDQQLAAQENQLITRSKHNAFEVLLEFMPFCSARLTVLAELVCVGNKQESKLALQMYIHKLAEYVANIPYMIEAAEKWRREQFSCEAYWTVSGYWKCKKYDKVEKKWEIHHYGENARGCKEWCGSLIVKFTNILFRNESLAPHFKTLALWAKANKKAKQVLQKEFGVRTDNGCYTDSRGTDYTGTVAKTKSGKQCKEWVKIRCNERKIGGCNIGFVFNEYNQYWKLGDKFAYDGDGRVADPKNYCRNPSEPQLKRFKAPYCITTDGKEEDCDVPRCAGFNKPQYVKRMLEVQESDEP